MRLKPKVIMADYWLGWKRMETDSQPNDHESVCQPCNKFAERSTPDIAQAAPGLVTQPELGQHLW
jgi:hypothetical protein